MKVLRNLIVIGLILLLFLYIDIKTGNYSSGLINSWKTITGLTTENPHISRDSLNIFKSKDTTKETVTTDYNEDNLISPTNNDVDRRIYTLVDRCIDGDTIVFYNQSLDQHTNVRILNIDTPEISGRIMPYGEEAYSYCKSHLEGNEVVLEVSKRDKPYDNYNRLLADVWIDGKLYQEEILKKGLAIVKYVYEPDIQYIDTLYNAQDYARKQKIGVFSIDNYIVDGDYHY